MGIKDLLRFMKPHIEPIHIKKYAGKRVGIDAYSWLHKGAYSCSMELCLNSDSDRKMRYLEYFMHRINLLRHHKVTPVVVFDGGNIPCKAATEEERHRKRKANRDLAMAKLKQGDASAAYELFQRAVSITPSMAHQVIQVLRSENIEYVVAPYEADAQLAYLCSLEAEKGGIISVITEDSDLIAYGCQAIVFKMDKFGNGEEIVLDKIFGSVARTPSFRNFDMDLFTGMCVLAGCDILSSIPGIGIGKAYALVSKYRNLDRVLSVLKFEKGNQMPDDYSKSFTEAVAVFQHAQIYDIDTKKLKHLKPLPENLLQSLNGELEFLGPEMPTSIANAIAEGYLDPISMEAFDHFPSSGCHPDSLVIQSSGQLESLEAAAVSTQESCITISSSHKTSKTDVSEKQRSVSNSSKYLKEAAALEKLILPSDIHGTVEIPTVQNRNSLKVPDNNPFKKRKWDEIQLDPIESITEQVSFATDESLGILCVTPDNTPLKVLDKSPRKRRLSDIQSDQTAGHVSGITDLGYSDTMCINLESQESVNSKPKRVTDGKRREKIEKSKRGSSKSSENKKNNSILNFFSRV
ncbi:exonuclease 1 [Juglans microcarpa x Juglans regia]|uniref:exonuclease 1 n=1 Tax=Juglans microcarpa x Juglans regia TaxID=2249226 RepID=UPI001B7DD8D3|nr:exonuclease 1 [Juglans microcarpa x Juglans regia]